jgi:predicted PurR-regulated permease PerM
MRQQPVRERTGVEERVPQDRLLRLLLVLATVTLGLALLALLLGAAARIAHTLTVFFIATLVAYTLAPAVGRLEALTRGRISRGWSALLALGAGIALLALLLAAAAGPTGTQLEELEARAPELRARSNVLAARTDDWLAERHIPFRIATGAQQLSRFAHDRSLEIAGRALSAASAVGDGIVDGLLVLLIAVYLLAFAPAMASQTAELVPSGYRPHLAEFRRDLNRVLGGFIRGQLVLAALMGLGAGVACALLRLPFSILIGLFVALTSLIPLVGAYVGAMPAVLLALLDPSAPYARLFWVVLLFTLLNETGSKILYPRLIGGATGFPPVLVLFVLLAGAEVAGILGALLGVPLTALVSRVVVHAYRMWQQGGQ